MQADETVLAGLDLGDASVSLMSPRPSRAFHQVYVGKRHLLAMYRSPALQASGRYVDAGPAEFTPIGTVFFRPAGYRLESRGVVAPVGGLHCRIGDERLRRSGFSPVDWSDHEREAALDIRATHLFSYHARLVNELANPGFGSDAVVDALLTILLADLARYVAKSSRPHESQEMHDRRIGMVVERICDLWETMPRVGELAELAGVSERQLLRLFRQRKGMTLAEFIRETRLEKTRYLLGQTDLPLKQVAHRAGFASQSTFAAAFRRETGMTPGSFRKEHRRRHFVPC